MTLADVSLAMQDEKGPKEGLSKLSMHYIDNAFSDVPLSDKEHGIFGCVPAEMLHVLGTGILKYLFESVSDLIGPNDSKKGERHVGCLVFLTCARCCKAE